MNSVIARAWKTYRVLQKGPETFESICEDILSLTAKLRLVDETCLQVELSAVNKQTLEGIIDGCASILGELEAVLERCRENHGVFEPDTDVQREVLEQENDLTNFLETLRSHSQEKLLGVLDQIREIKSGEFQDSIVTDWNFLEAELIKLGMPKDLVVEEFFFIEKWLKDNYPTVATEETAVIDELPDYEPGAPTGTIAEKVQELEQTTLVMREAPVAPAGPAASSPKAEPPPYTFESGADEFLDDNFSAYIDMAVQAEAKIRATQRQEDSELGVYPWSWLPPPARMFRKMKGVAEILPPDSFSVMAYETCPRLSTDVEALKRMMKVSYEGKLFNQPPIVTEALDSMKVLSKAIRNFHVLQQQSADLSRLSDLDILDYEASTAMAADLALYIPTQELELAQKGFYQLLTYMMGFVKAFSSIFTGRTHVTSSLDDIDLAWKALNMTSRISWIEKQLAAWQPIENATMFCRDFRRNNLSLRSQAIRALQNWETAEKIMYGEGDEITMKIVLASSLPKQGFNRAPNAWVKIVVYGSNSSGIGFRRFHELETETIHSMQDPTWNQSFKLDIADGARMLDIELYDKFGGMVKLLSKIRLKFSFVPGVDASFANRSLLYGLDEVFEWPLQITSSKGKEKAQPSIKVGLKWEGRLSKVQRLGLPLRPPGKMFRPDSQNTLAPSENSTASSIAGPTSKSIRYSNS